MGCGYTAQARTVPCGQGSLFAWVLVSKSREKSAAPRCVRSLAARGLTSRSASATTCVRLRARPRGDALRGSSTRTRRRGARRKPLQTEKGERTR